MVHGMVAHGGWWCGWREAMDGHWTEVEKSFPPRHVGEFNLTKVSRQDEGSNST